VIAPPRVPRRGDCAWAGDLGRWYPSQGRQASKILACGVVRRTGTDTDRALDVAGIGQAR